MTDAVECVRRKNAGACMHVYVISPYISTLHFTPFKRYARIDVGEWTDQRIRSSTKCIESACVDYDHNQANSSACFNCLYFQVNVCSWNGIKWMRQWQHKTPDRLKKKRWYFLSLKRIFLGFYWVFFKFFLINSHFVLKRIDQDQLNQVDRNEN